MRALALAFAFVACASGSELTDAQLVGPFVLHEAEGCGMVFDPAPELAEATQRAAERWSSATGCDVRVEAGGVPLVAWGRLFVDYLPDGRAALSEFPNPDGSSRTPCGLSTWREGEVAIIDVTLSNPECAVEYTVAHEMGHALAGVRGHSLSGVLADGENPAKSAVIDAASLGLVCESLPCSVFSPESA